MFGVGISNDALASTHVDLYNYQKPGLGPQKVWDYTIDMTNNNKDVTTRNWDWTIKIGDFQLENCCRSPILGKLRKIHSFPSVQSVHWISLWHHHSVRFCWSFSVFRIYQHPCHQARPGAMTLEIEDSTLGDLITGGAVPGNHALPW